MSAQKRPADESLLPHRLPKQPRRSPEPDASLEPSLGSQWRSLGANFTQLLVTTACSLFDGASKTDALLPTVLPEKPVPATNGTRHPHPRPKAGPSKLMPPPPPPHAPHPPARGDMPPPPVPRRRAVSDSTSESILGSSSSERSLPSSRASSSASSSTAAPPPRARHPHAENSSAETLVEAEDAASKARRPPQREHIFAAVHRARVEDERRREKEVMMHELYELKRSQGYESDFNEFRRFMSYTELLTSLDINKHDLLSPSPSLSLRSREKSPLLHRSQSLNHLRKFEDVDVDFVKRALLNARATMNEPMPSRPMTPSHAKILELQRAKDARIEARLRPRAPPLPEALPADAEAEVTALLSRRGVIAKFARETVTDQDLARLQPAQWLNDEIINFYGALILARAEGAKENRAGPAKANGAGPTAQAGRGAPLDAYYMSSFFWEKLVKDGYEAGRLAKWTKKVDIFSKDVVLVPVNHNNAHWTAAAINFRKKRIESFDSMGTRRENVYKILRAYMDAEHKNKKKKPFDFTGWEDYELEDTPQQENYYDCGVFTCQFMEALSRGEETFNFKQANMAYFRRRMVWEIAHTTLRDE